MVIWTKRKKGLYDDANFSHRDLVLYFRHQLRVKIKCDRSIQQKIGECSEPGCKKGSNFRVILPSSAGPWRLRYGSLGTPSLVSRIVFFLVFCFGFFSPM